MSFTPQYAYSQLLVEKAYCRGFLKIMILLIKQPKHMALEFVK